MKILSRFNDNKKWKDYYNFKSFEVKFSLFTSLVLLFIFYNWDIYSNFDKFIVSLQNTTLNIATAFIGMLGTILAGLAIIIGILQKKVIDAIERLNGKGSVYNILISFEFLAFNIGLGILLFYTLNLGLYSPKEILPKFTFYILAFLVIYFFFFIIFYTISLISNSIRVFYITNLYSEVEENEKNIIDIANELRIDFILGKTLDNSNTDKNQFMNELLNYVDMSNVPDKEAIKNYFKTYYN